MAVFFIPLYESRRWCHQEKRSTREGPAHERPAWGHDTYWQMGGDRLYGPYKNREEIEQAIRRIFPYVPGESTEFLIIECSVLSRKEIGLD